MLFQILELCDEFVPGNPPEYFFDRNPDNFPTILNIYRTGQFHMKEGGCALVLQKDLEYWIIGLSTLKKSCYLGCSVPMQCIQSTLLSLFIAIDETEKYNTPHSIPQYPTPLLHQMR